MSGPIDDALARLASASPFDAGGAEAELRDHPDKAHAAAAVAAALRGRAWTEETRRRAIRLLGELPGEEAASAVLSAARAPEPLLRAAAAIALERRPGDPRTGDALLALVHDSSRVVRAGACWSVARLKPGTRFLPALVHALNESAARTTLELKRPAKELAPEIRQDQRDVLRALDHLLSAPGFADAARPLAGLLREIADDPSADDPGVHLDAGSRAAEALAALARGRSGA